MSLIQKIKNSTPRTLILSSVLISTFMSCIISGVMSVFFNGFIAHEFILTGIAASSAIIIFLVCIILGLTDKTKSSETDSGIKDEEAFLNHTLSSEHSSSLYGGKERSGDKKSPVPELFEKTDPKWTMDDAATPYRVQFSVLGDRILYSCPSGFATAAVTRKSVALAKKVEDFIHTKHSSYIQIENFENLTGFTINARLTYINHFKKRLGIRTLIFFGVSHLDALSIKLATKLYGVDFNIKIVNSYQEAVVLAKDLADTLDEKFSNQKNADSHVLTDPENNIEGFKIVSDPSWDITVNGYRMKYEIINENIIHCVASGTFSSVQIKPMINMQKRLYDRVKNQSKGYHVIADVTNVSLADYRTRINYIRAQNDFHNKYPFESLSFYGSSQIINAAVNLGRPFLKYKMHMGNSLQEILKIIHDRSQGMMNEKDSVQMEIKDLDLDSYVADVLNYLGTLNPEIELSNPQSSKLPSDHPFRPVFDAIDLITNDLEQLAMERQKNEEYRLDMERKLATGQKMEALGTLSGGIAHDFNNILGSIIGYSEMLKDDLKGNEASTGFLEQILIGSDRAKQLVKQILLFSRQGENEKIPVKVSLLVKEVLKMLRASLPSTINVKMNIQTENDLILADPIQIHQVLMNLCTNAAHAMREDGGTLTIELGQEEKTGIDDEVHFDQKAGSYLTLRISDTGHGIPPEILDKIFDPFFSTKPRGEGTGLGLSVVHGIVKDCGGDIKVDSELNAGTEFSILLPLISQEYQNEEMKANSTLKGKEHVLFVDDEQPLVDLGKIMLERLGYKVTATSDSNKAWEFFQDSPDAFDVIVTDWTMPGITGMELSNKIQKLRPQKPVIMCTGFSIKYSTEQLREFGIRACISKPILQNELSETIRKVFDQQEGETV